MEDRALITGRRAAPWVLSLGFIVAVGGCGDDTRSPAGGYGAATGGSGGTAAGGGRAGSTGSGGRGGSAGSAVTAGGEGGQPDVSGGSGGGGKAGGGGSGASGGSSGSGTGGKGGGGGTSGDGSGGQAGALPDPFECPPEPDTDNPPASSPVCPVDRVWGDGERVSIPVSGADVLFSVTPDELSIAWGVVDVFSTGLYVADRADPSDDFGTPVELTDAVLAGSDQLSMSPDGLRLAAVVSGRLLESTRAARGDDFGAPSEGSFSLLNADADSAGASLADPVISPDDLTLYYSLIGDGDDTLHVSTRTGSGAWPVGRSVSECELTAHSGQSRIPLAISSDGLTLFYLDSPRGITRVAERPALDWPFIEFADLPGRSSTRPNAACDRLYYAGMGMLQFELLVADAE